MELSSLAISYATESDTRLALANPKGIIEWEGAGLTFVRSPKALTIVRAGAMGGDTFTVHGGWKYLTLAHLNQEWDEIKRVALAYQRGTRNAVTVRS